MNAKGFVSVLEIYVYIMIIDLRNVIKREFDIYRLELYSRQTAQGEARKTGRQMATRKHTGSDVSRLRRRRHTEKKAGEDGWEVKDDRKNGCTDGVSLTFCPK